MSLAKYMQLYREYGFFNGSTIRVRIPDTSFYGSDLILSKDGNVLRTRTIDDDVVDFFTDESGTLVLSADNGTSTLSGEVKISAYGTYNITLEGVSVDKSREVYAEKNVTLDDDKTTDTVAIGYTGDISKISAVSSNTSVCTVSVSGNKVTVKDAGKDFNGKATITATVEASQNYDAGEVNFYVNKLTGSYGTWVDGTDETVSRMIREADAGEINLADFWQIGETRRVHLDAITAGTVVAAQPEQDIDLVIMHNTTGNSYYTLTTPLESGKAYPNFAIGTKNCLERLSAMDFKSMSVTNGSSPNQTTTTGYVAVNTTEQCELLTMLNDSFIGALPQYLANTLKSVQRRYSTASVANDNSYAQYTTIGTRPHKVSIATAKEMLGININMMSAGNGLISDTTGVYINSGYRNTRYTDRLALDLPLVNNAINNCGTQFTYYANTPNSQKKKRGGNEYTDYLLPDATLLALGGSSDYNGTYAFGVYMSSDGGMATNVLTDETERVKLRGISPIMFI